ncbi:hypothetical protein [Maribellus sediminis]|jgi:hypothetical protein|uniref:hypothetical protein n=1 Tax=Maribellus sediminis TaxID=2696285 RepID=UPI0014303433|nr:hypothetical protein [Maribellus sediminis]
MKQSIRHIDNNGFWKGFYTVTLFLGLTLLYLETLLYRKTLIDISILAIIVVVAGIVTFTLTKKHYKSTYNLRGNFLPFIQSILSMGFIVSYLFLAANYYLSDNDITEHKLTIKSKSSLPGYRITSKRQPTVKIDYADFEKELVFYTSDKELVENAKGIILEIRKGALGFDIIDNYKIIRDKN